MKTFNEILAGMESVDHLESIELINGNGVSVGVIENKPGSQGSLKLYHHLCKQYGVINVDAAHEGLELYAEHTTDARAYPGKHPNIDRLLDLLVNGGTLTPHYRNKI